VTSLEARVITTAIDNKVLLQDFVVAMNPGECWAVLGRNGVGKTLLLHTLSGLTQPDKGNIYLDGQIISKLSQRVIAKKIAILLQHVDDPFPSAVINTVLTGRHPHLSGWQWEGSEDYQIARNALNDMSVNAMEQRTVNTLSGGERRRVALATVLTQTPDIFVLDEPINQLDPKHQMLVLKHFQHLSKNEKKCVIMAIHDINLAARFCSHAIMLFGEGAYATGTIADLFQADLLKRLYQHDLQIIEGEHGRFWFYT
jgi:iron complex transport system ATP-binding protein